MKRGGVVAGIEGEGPLRPFHPSLRTSAPVHRLAMLVPKFRNSPLKRNTRRHASLSSQPSLATYVVPPAYL